MKHAKVARGWKAPTLVRLQLALQPWARSAALLLLSASQFFDQLANRLGRPYVAWVENLKASRDAARHERMP